jgi:hypothetical protein
MRLTDHTTLNFNNMPTAVVFLDIEKALDTTWHNGLLYKLSTSLSKLISPFLSNRKLSVSVEGKMSTPRIMKARDPQGSVLSSTLFNMYINNTLQTTGVHLPLFADDTCLYATERKGGYVLKKSQSGLFCGESSTGYSSAHQHFVQCCSLQASP